MKEIIASICSVIIAFAALIFSIVSFKRQQDRADTYARASVKPLLSIKSQIYDDLKSIRIVNYGVGPAVIGKAEFRRGSEGVPTNKIVDLFNLNIVWESFVNVLPNRAIPAEGEILLIKASLAHLRGQGHDEKTALAILDQWQRQKTGIFVRIEYEDIYGNPMIPLDDILN
jgi:hypothetical protein